MPAQFRDNLGCLIAVDEGLDRLVRFDPVNPRLEWILPLPTKCRSLQLLGVHTLLAVTDTGWLELDARSGTILRREERFPSGVLSLQQMDDGSVFFGGIGLVAGGGVSFVQLTPDGSKGRTVSFGGDYVRLSSLTRDDTILFTCDGLVREGTWTGQVLREFSATGFRHAWKALRLPNGHTAISAGYGAFVAEFDTQGRELRRWECREHRTTVRPFFFGDFELLPDGGLLVCNWLGHGADLGASGYSLLCFDGESQLLEAWREPLRSSSLQTFVRPSADSLTT